MEADQPLDEYSRVVSGVAAELTPKVASLRVPQAGGGRGGESLGSAVVLKSTNQENTAPWSGTSHVTFRLNIVRNTGAGVSIAAHPEMYPVDPLHSVVITDNIISNISVGEYSGPSTYWRIDSASIRTPGYASARSVRRSAVSRGI